MGHRGMVYHDGINEDFIPFNTSCRCDEGGLYFASRDILSFIDYGSDVYEVEPIGEVVEISNYTHKFKAHALYMKRLGEWCDINVFKYLVESGADIHTCDDYVFCEASARGYIDVVKFLIELGVDVHTCHDFAVRTAARHGYLDLVKFLVESGADFRVYGDIAYSTAAEFKHYHVTRYLKSVIDKLNQK